MAERQTVNVGCRIPNGVVLHVMERVKRNGEPVEPPRFKDRGLVELAGFARHNQGLAPGRVPRREAFTAVDKELADIWMAENSENPLVKSGMVFVPKSDEEKAEDDRRAAEEQNRNAEQRAPQPPSEEHDGAEKVSTEHKVGSQLGGERPQDFRDPIGVE